MDIKSHTLYCTRKEKGTREFVIAFLADTCTKGMYLILKAVADSTRTVRIKIKFLKFYKCTPVPTDEKGEREKASFV